MSSARRSREGQEGGGGEWWGATREGATEPAVGAGSRVRSGRGDGGGQQEEDVRARDPEAEAQDGPLRGANAPSGVRR